MGPEVSLLDVASELAEAEIGALVVMGQHGPVGVISERDVVRALAVGGEPTELWLRISWQSDLCGLARTSRSST